MPVPVTWSDRQDARPSKAATARSMSSSVVRQFDTESRIAERPSQTVPLIHASPLVLDVGEHRVRRLVVCEAEEDLVQDDVVQHLAP